MFPVPPVVAMKSSVQQKLRLVYLLFICLALLLPARAFAAYSFSIDSARIQGALLMHFPLREYTAAARLSLLEPAVILRQGADNLQLDIPVVASISGVGRKRGQLVVDVGLHYKPASGELFLGIPTIRRFDMAEISPQQRQTFRANLSDIVLKALPLVRIHRVREEDLNHSLAMSEMKAVQIEDGRLRVSIGFD